MSNPIAQTFFINEPEGGVEGVYVTAIHVYFKSISSVYGVTLDIRTTDNGVPTRYRLPDGQKVLRVTDEYPVGHPRAGQKIIQASSDGSVATEFIFDTPVLVQSKTSYAFTITPTGGTAEYKIWTAEIGGSDVRTNTPIIVNNDTGTLFLSSNDIQFTSIISEDIKFDIFVADFTYNNGVAVYKAMPLDNIVAQGMVGSLIQNEEIFMTNGAISIASLTYTGNTGTFSLGETIFQSNGTANVATGKLWSVDASKLLLEDCTGSWTTGYQVKGATTLANATITVVAQDVTSYSNTTLTVPFVGNSTVSYFSVNQPIYVGTNNRSKMQPTYITVVPASTSANLTVNSNLVFSEASCLFGKLRGANNGLSTFGLYSGVKKDDIDGDNEFAMFINHVPAGTVDGNHHFANSEGEYVIGYSSKASALCLYTRDIPYSTIVPQFLTSTSKSTNISLSMKGIKQSNTYDTTFTKLVNSTETEYKDTVRRYKSRSHEILIDGANNTTTIYATLTSSNNKVSPYIDTSVGGTTLVRNMVLKDEQTSGYIVDIDSLNGRFIASMSVADNVRQSNGTVVKSGGLLFANDSILYVSNPSGVFESGYSIYAASDPSVNAQVLSVKPYDEKYPFDINYKAGTRYMSKTVTLADQQDAEDLRTYLTAYRPAGTNFKVYSRVLNAEDPDQIKNKIWTKMVEVSSPALISSGINENDFVELVYDLPESNLVFANNTTCSNTSANITVYSTSSFSSGDFVYLYNTSSNTFIVRQVVDVPNNTVLTLDSNSSFSSTNADIGVIPYLEDKTSAFKFSNNNLIARYVSNTDVVYDSFKYFAVKIIPVSNNPAVVPRAADMRALALQV